MNGQKEICKENFKLCRLKRNGERNGCKKWQRHISWFADHIDHKPSETIWFSHRDRDTNIRRVASVAINQNIQIQRDKEITRFWLNRKKYSGCL